MSEFERRRKLNRIPEQMGQVPQQGQPVPPEMLQQNQPQGVPYPQTGMGAQPAAFPGAAPGGVPGRQPAGYTPGQAPDAEVRAVRTGEEEAAFHLGERVGAESQIGRPGFSAASQPQGMTRERLEKAMRTLLDYKKAKASVDRRVIAAQEWWKLRNWEQIQNNRGTKGAVTHKSNTAWLWNCIVGKHADAIDSYPEPVILPRMTDDKEEAKVLSEIIPVVLQMNGFEDTYSRCQWQKMQEGTAVYFCGWDKQKLGGMGDISIKKTNILNLFWEPGIDDIQDSANVFYTRLVDNERLEQQYPQLVGKLKNPVLKPSEYRKDDSVPTDDKSVVVDWYYHTWDGPRKILNYCQFVNEEVLYSTEQQGDAEGLYADGDYPFVLDPLFPVEGSPAGYGYIDIGKDSQTDIDTINQAMVQNAIVTSTPRHFLRSDGTVNEDEFADWSKPFVHVNGTLGEDSIRQIMVNGIQGSALEMLRQKIDELKFVTGNTDVNNGGVPTGVTAASAIAALKEDSGRSSKDSTKAAYRSFTKLVNMVIERIRQFYELPRQFRILGENAQEQFIEYTNAKLQEQQMGGGLGLDAYMRKPVFDVDVRAQRENAYTKMSQNELALQFKQIGVFDPQGVDQSLMMLDMMDFKGKDELVQKVQEMGTMQETLVKVSQIALQLAQQYAPEVAEELAMIIQDAVAPDQMPMQQGGGGPVKSRSDVIGNPMGGDAAAPMQDPNESSIVRKSRERVTNATRPD